MSQSRVERLQAVWAFNLPAVRPHYAVKCNPDPKLIAILQEYGFGFDCASQRELSLITPSSNTVIYANPCKSDRDIHYAKTRGSPLTVIDSCEEVEKILDYKGGALVRIRVDDSGSKMPFGAKFGADPAKVAEIGEFAKKAGVHLKGISFHVGSESGDVNAHQKAIQLAAAACSVLLKQGHDAAIIDIGGGFVPDVNKFTLQAVKIREEIRNKKAAGLRFIAEPGRFFATEAQDLFVQVIGKKPAYGGVGWRYTIDESLYGQFTNILFDHQKPTWVRIPAKEGSVGKTGAGILFGRTCDSLDVIARSDTMEELEIGDWLWFPHMGAYTTVTASEFNGFPKPPVFLDELPNRYLLPASASDIKYIRAVSARELLH